MGYRKARHKLSCIYSVGFYEEEAAIDKPRSVVLRVKGRPDLRIIHPSAYVVRSQEQKRERSLTAAWFAPELFQDGIVRTHIFPLRPAGKGELHWEALLAVNFPVQLPDDGSTITRHFGATLLREPGEGTHRTIRVEHEFHAPLTIQVKNESAMGRTRYVTFVEPVSIEPGHYGLTTVLSEPEDPTPHSDRLVRVLVPSREKKQKYFMTSILGRRSGSQTEVIWGPGTKEFRKYRKRRGEEIPTRHGDASRFEPLLVQQIKHDEPAAILSSFCSFGEPDLFTDLFLERKILSKNPNDSATVLTENPDKILLDRVEVEGEGKIKCQTLLDLLEKNSLEPGEYTFEMTLRIEDRPRNEEFKTRIDFSVLQPPVVED